MNVPARVVYDCDPGVDDAPAAGRQKLESGVLLTMVGLNLAHRVLVTRDRIAPLRADAGQVASVSADLLEYYADAYARIYGWPGAVLHDPCAIA